MRNSPTIYKRADGHLETGYGRDRNEAEHIMYGCCYSKTYEEAEEKRKARIGAKQSNENEKGVCGMNLLFVGADSRDAVIKGAA